MTASSRQERHHPKPHLLDLQLHGRPSTQPYRPLLAGDQLQVAHR